MYLAPLQEWLLSPRGSSVSWWSSWGDAVFRLCHGLSRLTKLTKQDTIILFISSIRLSAHILSFGLRWLPYMDQPLVIQFHQIMRGAYSGALPDQPRLKQSFYTALSALSKISTKIAIPNFWNLEQVAWTSGKNNNIILTTIMTLISNDNK